MNEIAAIIQRPELTLPKREAGHLRAAFEAAEVILEYGIGGSTVMAAEMPGKTITSIETDKKWVDKLQGWFDQNPCQSTPDIIWANIGETKEWGRPADDAQLAKYPRYSLDIWQLSDFIHPDVAFIDGRFRAACVLAIAFNCKCTTRVFVDDYKARGNYHVIEKYVGAPRLIGRMAEFEINPTPIPAMQLLEIITLMQDPR